MKINLLVITCLVFAGCSQSANDMSLNKTTLGTLTGAAIGAGTGAIIGNQTGHAGQGVAIGAGLGALGGAVLGNSLDQTDKKNEALDAEIGRNQQMLEENRRMIEELKRRGADAKVTDRGVVINLPDILFEFDRANLTSRAERTIDEISEVLKGNQRQISVEGHTDSLGTVAYNKDLSRRRASSVANALRNRSVSGPQIAVVGYGEGAPIASNNSDAGRSRNRRVEIVVQNN